eukprot:UN06498
MKHLNWTERHWKENWVHQEYTGRSCYPSCRKADLKGNISKLEDQLREAKKKMGKENIQKAVKTAIDAAEAAVSEGKPFCVIHADVGLDTNR